MKNPISFLIEKLQRRSKAQIGLLVVLAASLGLALAGRTSRPYSRHGVAPRVAEYPQREIGLQEYQAASGGLINENDLKDLPASATTRGEFKTDLGRSAGIGLPGVNPLIAHTAEVAVATKEFARSRSSLEEILERHRGYAAKLRMVGQKSGSVLSATLRVPSTELSGTVSDLKSLGEVEREEQAADEVTQQRADLDARLANAQNTLRRLQELLKKQTYPDGNVRELQRQIASASAEVARLEAERLASEHRVVFANVFFTLKEQMSASPESFGAQLKSAAAAGFGDAMTSLSALLMFLIGRGPVVALWCAILWLPVRMAWKKWAPAESRPAVVQAS